MNFELKTFPNDATLAETAAKEWLELAATSPHHLIALSGGRIAKTFFAAVAKNAKDLSNIDFFWADERCVPAEHPDSNFLLANDALFRPLNITPSQIHRLRGELEPAAAVNEANLEINRLAQKNAAGFPVLDFIILGLGEDGHIASLFPNASDEIINCRAAYLSVSNSPKPPPNRLSLSFGVLAAAKEVWVLAAGSGKETALRASLRPDGQTPLARVLRSRAQTKVFTDIAV